MNIEILAIWTLKGIAFGFGGMFGAYLFYYISERFNK